MLRYSVLLFLFASLWGRAQADSLTLSQAIQQAWHADPARMSLEARLGRLEAAVNGAGAPAPLQARASISAGSGKEDANQLLQVLELGGQPRLRRETAVVELEQARLEFKQRQLALARTVSESFLSLAGVSHQLLAAGVEEQAQGELLKITRGRYEAGDIPQLQVFRVERDLAEVQRERLSLAREQALARLHLETLVGVSFLPDTADSVLPPVLPSLVPAELEELGEAQRPEVLVRLRTLQARQLQLHLVTAERAPTLETALYRSNLPDPTSTQGLSVTLGWPLHDWGTRQHAQASAAADVLQAQAEWETTRRDVRNEVRQAYARWAGLEAEIAMVRDHELLSAQSVVDLSRRGFAGGVTNQLDVLEAHHSLRTAQRDLQRLQTEQTTAAWDLYWSIGSRPDAVDTRELP